MNIARLFSYTKRVEGELERERAAHEKTRQDARVDREALIDAFARARGASAVYAPLPPPEHPLLGKPAAGPTATAAREAAKRQDHERHTRRPTEAEIEEAARKAIGTQPAVSRPNGDAEPAEPI